MKKLFLHITLFFFMLIVVDRILGSVLEYFFYKQYHGDDYITLRTLESTNEEIVILGSSRASHHYISDSIESYTGMRVFNAGRDNMGIHYIKSITKELCKKYTPKFIVIDIIPYNFMKGYQDDKKYFDVQTSALLPLAYKHQGLYDDIAEMSPLEVWKSKLIKTYPFNSMIGTIVQNSYTDIGHKQIKGYEPVYGKIDTSNYHDQLFKFPTIDKGIDTNAFLVLKECLRLCKEKKVKVLICFSPYYFKYEHEPLLWNEFDKLSKEFNCEIADFSSDSMFIKNADLFYDEIHMNNEGAAIFSKKIAQKIMASKD